uniref:G_PROTEIN_RECEP_F1_2 domain-containing protein n=1 Tax=Strongyloides papillosus TaxID=174720 RepID=A0A0N5CC42_STREA
MVVAIVEIFQLAYYIPSVILMIFVGTLLLYKILTKSKAFQNEFYPMVCYRTFNDLAYQISMIGLLKLPSWSIMPQMYLDSTYLAAVSYVFGATTFCVPFIHTFFLSGLRYMAIYHPVKYTRISSPRTSIILCSLLLIISLSIGLPSLAYSSRYVYNNVTGIISSTYLDKSVAYYQFAYVTFFYLPIIIISAIFNVANFIGLSKTNKRNKNKRSETLFAVYSLFTFFTTCLMEAYLGSRIIGNFLGNQTIISVANYSLQWIGDLGTFGDFYFFIFINSEIRAAIKEIVCKVFGIKYAPSFVKTTEIKSIHDGKSIRGKHITTT